MFLQKPTSKTKYQSIGRFKLDYGSAHKSYPYKLQPIQNHSTHLQCKVYILKPRLYFRRKKTITPIMTSSCTQIPPSTVFQIQSVFRFDKKQKVIKPFRLCIKKSIKHSHKRDAWIHHFWNPNLAVKTTACFIGCSRIH